MSTLPNKKLHIDPSIPPLALATISSDSVMGERLAKFSSKIWDHYQTASVNFEPRKLCDLLNELISSHNLDIQERVAAVSGLIVSFCAISKVDGEFFSRHQCATSILCSLLPWSNENIVRAYLREQIHVEFSNTQKLLGELFKDIQADSNRILTHNAIFSDLYFLPLRITRILGLIGMLALAEDLLGYSNNDISLGYREMVNILIDSYPDCLVTLDDEQAAPLYIFLKAALKFGWEQEGKEVVELYYADAALRAGVFNRLGSDGEGALEHILSICESDFRGEPRLHANPTSLLPVILLGGIQFRITRDWNLRAFDRRQIGLFIPDNYYLFNQDIIRHGQTHTLQIGFGVWKTSEFETEFNQILSSRSEDFNLSPETHVLCMMAAMLFPDRIPLGLESIR